MSFAEMLESTFCSVTNFCSTCATALIWSAFMSRLPQVECAWTQHLVIRRPLICQVVFSFVHVVSTASDSTAQVYCLRLSGIY